tara:strand:- start:224 stop:637 length:414 start_codon:yes stop_codon:yes gene_type:complete
VSANLGKFNITSPTLPKPLDLPVIHLKPPSARIPSYNPMVVPPANLEAPRETKSKTKESTEQPAQPKLNVPVLDIQLPLPTAEVVATATYAAVAAVATTTLATPFFDQIKKKLTKFLQGKINKWKEKRKKKKDSSES